MEPEAHAVAARDGLVLNVWEQPAVDAATDRTRTASGRDVAGRPVHGSDDAGEAVLFVHGSITCSRALFAPPVPDDDSYSWLAATARAGRTAFALDVRGYGDSERPPELNEPPEANDPPVRADRAANDIGDALGFVRDRGFDDVHLVGVSWGTNTCGRFVERDDPDLASLTQVAPVYRVPYDVEDGLAALGLDSDFDAYYTQEYDTVKERQGAGDAGDGDADGDGKADELFEAVWRTQVESNQGVDEETYIAQSGALADYYDCGQGDPPYDAANLDVPTLVLRGTEDAISAREDALALYDELGVDADEAEYAELAGADHYVMHGHRRQACYDAVTAFHDRA